MNKKNTAITLSIVSSIILASIGFEIISNHSERVDTREETQTRLHQIRITSDFDEEIAYADSDWEAGYDNSNTLQYLHRQKIQKAKRIQELTQELNETKNRLHELKTNIVIHGGEKELEYRTRIENLENQLKETENESTKLKSNLAAREALIESKRDELENLSKIFTQTHSTLEKNLEDAESKIQEEQKQIDLFILQIQEKLSVNEQDAVKFDNLEQILHKINDHIIGLQTQVSQATQNFELEKSRAEELQAAVDNLHKNYVSSQLKINYLEEKYNNADQKSQDLLSQLQVSQKSTSKMASDIAEMKKLKKQLTAQEARVNDLERQLSLAKGYYKIEQQRSNDLEAALKKCNSNHGINLSENVQHDLNEINDLEEKLRNSEEKNRKLKELFEQGQPNGTAHFKQCAILSSQQDKLIQDLEKSLSIVEKRNKELLQQIAKTNTNQYSNSNEEASNESILKDLKMRLKQSEDHIEQLKAQIASSGRKESTPLNSQKVPSHESQKGNHHPMDDEAQQIIKELKSKQEDLYSQIKQLKNALAETKKSSVEQSKDNIIPQPTATPINVDLIEKFDEFFKDDSKNSEQQPPQKISVVTPSNNNIIAMGEDSSNLNMLTESPEKTLTDKEKEATKKLQEKQNRVASLEKRLQKLQESQANQSEREQGNTIDPSSSNEIFKAKIAYLTTRLTQEKMKLTRAQHELNNSLENYTEVNPN